MADTPAGQPQARVSDRLEPAADVQATSERPPTPWSRLWGRHPLRRGLILATVLIVVAAGGFVLWPRRPAAVPMPTDLAVHVPTAATVGDALTVQVTGAADGAPVTLTMVGSLGTSTLTASNASGQVRFALPNTVTAASGDLTVLASSGGATAQGTIQLIPGAVVGPIQAVVGSRSIVADGTDLAMVVTMPVDQFGNTVAEGTPVDILRRTPAGTVSSNATAVQDLLAWHDLPSGTIAGRGEVWVEADGKTGPQASLDEVAGSPAPFSLFASDTDAASHLTADGQSLVPLQTSVLRDKYGNLEPDGTTVLITWQEPEGPALATGVTIGGVARLSVQAPDRPATLHLEGTSRGTPTAAALALPFATAVAGIPVTIRRSSPDIVVTVGPVVEPDGSFVPDGSDVAVTVADGTGRSVANTGGLVNGQVSLALPDAGLTGALTARATVLGSAGTAHLP